MLKGLREATKHMKLVNTTTIFKQGERAYRLGIELRDNPFRPERALEYKVWGDGWKSARNRWTEILKRNEGALGARPSYANPSNF